MSPVITRFAPSPTGELHLGHAYAAWFAFDAARREGGQFLLRIEDIDGTRSRPEFVASIETDLAWLGLSWQKPVRLQSECLSEYQAALDQLAAQELLYPCFCTRAEIKAEIEAAGGAPQGPDGPVYPGTCRTLDPAKATMRVARGDSHAIRLNMSRAIGRVGPLSFHDADAGTIACDPAPFGDIVLARKDTPTSYHLAVTVDDAAQGITLVTRGVDLLPATHCHRLLQALLDLPVPDYHHHRLILGPDGKRLAKRDHAASLESLRANGVTPAEIKALVGLAV
jgi:glutamyl-Q tRNA(Asp) synthetase